MNTSDNKRSDRLKQRYDNAKKATAKEMEDRAKKKQKAQVTKRKASKDTTQKSKSGKTEGESKAKKPFELNKGLKILIAVIVSIAVVIAILYPVGKTYYQQLREKQRYEAELEALNDRNEELQSENEALDTDEGVADEARELGWTEDGENLAIITNISNGVNEGSDHPDQVISEDIEPPRTWYYDILDVIFFVKK